MIGSMTRIARLVAATLALVLALFPLAMERCRTACAMPAASAQTGAGKPSSSAHACHEGAAGAADVIAIPVPRTCGHSDEAGARDGLTFAASRTRIGLHVPAAVVPADVAPAALEILTLSPPGLPVATDPIVPRNLPLRL
jgi:hypothetical protein